MAKERVSVTLRLSPFRKERRNFRPILKSLILVMRKKLRRLISRKNGSKGNKIIRLMLGTKGKNIKIDCTLKCPAGIVIFWFQISQKRFREEISNALDKVRSKDFIRARYIRLEALQFQPLGPLPKFHLSCDENEVRAALPKVQDQVAGGCPIYGNNYHLFPMDPLIEAIYLEQDEESKIGGEQSKKIPLVDSTRIGLKRGVIMKTVPRRRSRIQSNIIQDIGNFRQTKIEEYFKPLRFLRESEKDL